MGVDLGIYIVAENATYSKEYLDFERDYELQEAVLALKTTSFNNNKGLRCMTEEGYENILHDCYAQDLVFITSNEISKLKGKYDGKNGQIIDFLSSLENHLYVLYFH